MVQSDGAPSPTSIAPKRNRISCRQCRVDKKRCLPAGRNWSTAFEKCTRCSILGHACSEPEKASGKFGRKKSMVAIACKAQSPPFTQEQESPATMTEYSDSPTSVRSSNTASDYDAMDVESVNVQTALAQTVSSDCQLDRDERLSDKARSSIIRLGDLNATREILRRILGLCTRVGSWLGVAMYERAAIEAYIQAVQGEFKAETQKVMELVLKGLDCDSEIIVSALLLIVYRFEHPFDRSDFVNLCIDDRVLQQLSQISRQTRTICSDADLVCASALGFPMRHDPTGAIVKLYIKASAAVTQVLCHVVLDDVEQRNMLPRGGREGFPPCHIAYMHGNESAALQLWNRSEVDMLGRTLVHLVAYASDSQMLRRLFKHDRTAAHDTKADIFGLSPLAIAACQGDLSCFSLLWQFEADRNTLDFSNRSVLALAARNGGFRVVSCILQSGSIPRSPRHELLEAVQSSHDSPETIVQMLMNYYTKHPDCLDQSVLIEASHISLKRGSSALVHALTASSTWYPELTASETLPTYHPVDFDSRDVWEVLTPAEPNIQCKYIEDSWCYGDAATPTEFTDVFCTLEESENDFSWTTDPRTVARRSGSPFDEEC